MKLKYVDVDGNVDWRYKKDMFPTLIGLAGAHGAPNIIEDRIEPMEVKGEQQILETGHIAFADGFKVYYYALACQTGNFDLEHGMGGWQLCRDVYCEQKECEDM